MIPYIVEDIIVSRSPRVAKMSRSEQNAAVNNGIILILLRTRIKQKNARVSQFNRKK